MREFCEDIARRLQNVGGEVFYVGGCVRNVLLKQRGEEVDMEVFHVEVGTLRSKLEEVGTLKGGGESFGIFKFKDYPVDIGLPRFEVKRGEGHRDFEVRLEPFATLREAAIRRDFTINALYLGVLDQVFHDPLCGLEDLKCRVLRHCGPKFSEDPLRVLRAMQLMARFKLSIHPSTLALCRGMKGTSLKGSHHAQQWRKLLFEALEPSRGLAFLKRCNWLRFYPAFAKWGDRDCFKWRCVSERLDAFAAARGGKPETNLQAFVFSRLSKEAVVAEKVAYSLLLLDVPVKEAEDFLVFLAVSQSFQSAVISLIRCLPGVLKLPEGGEALEVKARQLAHCLGGLADLLVLLYFVDVEKASCFFRLAEKLSLLNSAAVPLITGEWLLKIGLEEGPIFRLLLKDCYEAQLKGLFQGRQEASFYLKEELKKHF